MDGDDGTGFGGHCFCKLDRIHVVMLRIYIDDHGFQVVMEDHIEGRNKCHGWDDDFVAIVPFMDFLERGNRDVEGAGAAVAHNPKLTAMDLGECFLESLAHWSVGQAVAIENLHNKLFRFRSQL